MKTLLSHAYFLKEDEKEQNINKPYPPLGLLCISAHLSSKGFNNDVFDSTFRSEDELLSEVHSGSYNMLGLYCNLMTKVNVVRIIKEIRKKGSNILIVLGGPDVRYNSEDYLKTGADILVIGEGEEAMSDIAARVVKGENDWKNIKGIAFLEKGNVHSTSERPMIKRLDDLPIPAYNKIDLNLYLNYWEKHHGSSMVSISTQRGCPYTCKWCSTAVFGQSYRRKSPEKTVQEMLFLKETYNPKALWFVDDVFTVSHKWLESFVEELKKNHLKIPFECITRADRMNEAVINLLKEAGCFRVWIGAESGSQKILDAMDRRVSAETVRQNIRATRKAGIEAGTFIMLGYPGETEKDIYETIDHLSESNPNHFTITLTYPIKGTSLYDEVKNDSAGHINWELQTDRERKFNRTYPDAFYKHAIRKVVNEVKYRQAIQEKSFNLDTFIFKVKSQIAGLQMKICK